MRTTGFHTLLPLMAACLFQVATGLTAHAQNQGIFNGLSQNENLMRGKVREYSVSVTSDTSPQYIPANIYYNLIYKEILSDPALMAGLSGADATIIRNLPAHTHDSFVREDHRDLDEICTRLQASGGEAADIIDIAQRFDDSRLRRQRLLNIHYEGVRASLTETTRQRVDAMLLEFSRSRNITYAVFDMSGFARELPSAARTMLQSGCNEFNARLEDYTPHYLTLAQELDEALMPIE